MDKTDSLISYITLGVTQLEVLKEFYSALGFTIIRESKQPNHPFCMFSSGSIVLALYPKPLLAKQAGCEILGKNSAMCLSLNVKHQSSVGAYLETAHAHGAKISRQPFIPDWGGYCGYFHDPEGNLWEVVWHENFDWTDNII